jgi:hypothetical protein
VATPEGVPFLRCVAEQTLSVIEAYQACCAALAGLSDDGAPMDKKELRRRAAQYFEHSALLGEAARPEAANDATFSNVLGLLVERGVLVEESVTNKRSVEIVYARGENWPALTELRERLAAAVSYR